MLCISLPYRVMLQRASGLKKPVVASQNRKRQSSIMKQLFALLTKAQPDGMLNFPKTDMESQVIDLVQRALAGDIDAIALIFDIEGDDTWMSFND